MKKLLLGDKIFLPGGLEIEDGRLLIENGIILAAGGQEISLPDEGEIIEYRGGYLMPGLVDVHCHTGLLEEVNAAGDDINEMMEPISPELRVLDGIYPGDIAFQESLAEGITSLCVMPGSSNILGGQCAAISTYGKTVDEMLIDPYVGQKGSLGENPKKDYGKKGLPPFTRMGEALLLRKALEDAIWYQERKEKGLIEKQDWKHEALLPVLEGKIPLRIHAHRSDDMMTALRIVKEFNVPLVIEHATEAGVILEEIKEAGISLAVGPLLISRYKEEMKERDLALPVKLEEADIPFALLTDAPELPGFSLRLIAILAHREGLSRKKALLSITENAAGIMGLAGKLGSLKTGNRADIAVFSGDPLDIYARVTDVFIGGVKVK